MSGENLRDKNCTKQKTLKVRHWENEGAVLLPVGMFVQNVHWLFAYLVLMTIIV